jgi:pentatricopeptide repeat protein
MNMYCEVFVAENHLMYCICVGYGKKGQWQEAENVVDRMKAKGVKPNSQSFSFLLEAYSLSGQIPKGELLISKMKDGNLISGTPGYNAFLRFYCRAGDIGSAFQTYEMLRTSGPKLNQSSFVPMIEALTQEGAVDERFWGIIQDIENAPFEAKYVIHSALLSTLARCGPTQDGMRVLKTLELLGCPQDVLILFKSGAVSQGAANTEDDIWKRMTGLFNSIEREGTNLEAERNFHNALIDALWSFQYEMRALKLTELSVTLGVFGSNVCEWQGDGWALDLRHTGVGASQVLLLTWLAGIREDIKSGGKMSSKIRILLAWEWQLRTGENWAARDAMAARLKELKAPFVLVKDGQQLEVNASTLRKWLLREITARRLVFNSRV